MLAPATLPALGSSLFRLAPLLLLACGAEAPEDAAGQAEAPAEAAAEGAADEGKGDGFASVVPGGDTLAPPGGATGPAIAWASFTAPNPSDADSLRLRDILLNTNRYSLTRYYHARGFDTQTGQYLDFDRGGVLGVGSDATGEFRIRAPASVGLALAVSLRLGIYDVPGVPRATALAVAKKLISSVAYRHRINSAGGWGHDWQTPLWALYAGTAGWLLWDELGATDAEYVRKMVEDEGRRLVGYPVPYYRSDSGALLSSGDSKAEENAWNAQFLYLAVNMMPSHPLRKAWEYKAAELAVSAHARPSDVTSNTQVVGGRPVRSWLRGSNVNADSSVINHGIVHPDYMATAAYAATAPIWYGLRRRPTPDTMFVRVADVYEALVELPWTPGTRTPGTSCPEGGFLLPCRVASPGGTIYPDNQSSIYFPHGTDWGTGRRMNFALFDVVARHFALDGLVADAQKKAGVWEARHAQAALDMQLRSADRRTYLSSSEDSYPEKEEWVAAHAALAYLVKWISAQGAYSRTGAFIPVVIDDQDREFNVTGPWEKDQPAGCLAYWNVYHEGGGASGSRRAQWKLKSPLPAGRYRVSAWWSAFANHATDTPYTVFHRGGQTVVRVNQRTGGGQWNRLGEFDFDGTTSSGYVELWNKTSTGYVVADGVMFERL